MSDQPRDDLSANSLLDHPLDEDSGWFRPADAASLPPAPAEDDTGWYVPPQPDAPAPPPAVAETEDGLWQTPPPAEDALWQSPEAAAPARKPEPYAGPGAWYAPPDAAAVLAGDDGEGTGEWHVPEAESAGSILAGVADTVYPIAVDAPEPMLETEAQAEPGFDPLAQYSAGVRDHAPAAEDEPFDPLAQYSAKVHDRAYETVADTEPPALEPAADQGEMLTLAPQTLADQFGDSMLQLEPEAEGLPEGITSAAAAQDTGLLTISDEESPEAVAARMVAALGGQGAQAAQAEPPRTAEDSALLRLVDQFDAVESDVRGLRQRYQRGEISQEDLQGRLRQLMILDGQGNWWMVGMESDNWYRYDGQTWTLAERPRRPGDPLATPGSMLGFGPTEPMTAQLGGLGPEPTVDPDATMVGPTATEFDRLPGYGDQATVLQETVLHDAAYDPYKTEDPFAEAGYGAEEVGYEDEYPADVVERAQDLAQLERRERITRIALFSVGGVLLLFLCGIVSAIGFYMIRVGQYSDRIEALRDVAGSFQTTQIFDAQGNLLSRINDPTGGTRISVPLEEISPFLIHATISTEDQRFYQNAGWDALAIVRAALQNQEQGVIVSGASTITQQLAKSLVLDPERRTELTLDRKIDEAIIAAEIGRRYTKDEILEIYLNEIYYGNLAYGAEAAAQTYFGISARDLNLPQAAFLVGLVGAPATYDPVLNRDPLTGRPEAAIQRMNAVITFMLEEGCIQFQHTFTYQGRTYGANDPFCVDQALLQSGQVVLDKAIVETTNYAQPQHQSTFPHFVNFVAQQLEETYGLTDIYRAGFNVFTTIDPDIQRVAQQAATAQVADFQARGIGGNNAAVVVMDPRDGAILAMVGSVDFNNEAIDGQVNVALSAQQPGSSIKPLVYVSAFAGGADGSYWTPATVIWDTPTDYSGYRPVNYDNTFHGPNSVRVSLGNSYNVPAVKTMAYVTPERFEQTARAMGLTFPGFTPTQAGLPGALGAFDVRLYDMVVAYGVFANGGRRVTPYAITRITDNAGNPVALPERPQPAQVINPEHAFLINDILSDTSVRGAFGGTQQFMTVPGYTTAIKTGTTNDNRDNWAIGYTPNVVVGVWHGNTDNSPMSSTAGSSAAAPIWQQVMLAALTKYGTSQFPVPANVTVLDVCADTGTAPTSSCTRVTRERFVAAQPPPSAEEGLLVEVQVNTLTGQRANDFCPNFNEPRVYLNVGDPTAIPWINSTAAGQQWAVQRGLTVPVQAAPTEFCNSSTPIPIIDLETPAVDAQVNGVVEIRGRVQVFNFQSYEIQIGVGRDPDTFVRADGPYGQQVANTGLLGRWDATQFADGDYTVRLRVTTSTGGFAILDHTVRVIRPQNVITIQSPAAESTVQGVVEIVGTVQSANFQQYELQYGQSRQPGVFIRFDGPYNLAPAAASVLGRWDTGTLPSGEYTIRLAVLTTDGQTSTLDRIVRVQGIAVVITATPTTPGPIVVTATPTTPAPLVVTATPTATQQVIVITDTPPPAQTVLPPFDPNTATPVNYQTGNALGTISSVEYARYYTFDGAAGDVIEITATNTGGDLDTYVYLLDAFGNILAENDDGGTGTDSVLQFTLGTSGSFIIAVTRYEVAAGTTSGEFRMSLSKLN